jgi:hypothetical protein
MLWMTVDSDRMLVFGGRARWVGSTAWIGLCYCTVTLMAALVTVMEPEVPVTVTT